MAKKNTISQLDLVMLGRRGFPARLGAVEGQVKRLVTGSGGEGEAVATQDLRPNLLTNSSFEFYDRGSTKPQDWIVDGAGLVSVGSAGVDGTNSMRLPSGAMVRQLAAAGATVPQSSVVVSVAAKTEYAGQKISINVGHVPGGQTGPIMRLDLDGNLIQTDDVPPDGNWYRFYRSLILNGGNVAEAQVAQAGSGTLEIDAVKLEKEDGVASWLEPTAYVSADWGAATHIRNLAADNIVTGTLVVGGATSTNPRISVKDENDIEIVTIGDPTEGFYGIEIKGAAGFLISGTGSAEVSGGGSVKVKGGGDITVDGGDINVTNGGVNISGTGGINVNAGGGVVINSGGGLTVLGGGSALISGDLTIGGTTTLGGTATIGGNLLMGTGGLLRIGGATGKRILWAASGMEAYDVADNRRMFLDVDTATWRFFGENSVVMEGDGSLKAGELAWVDAAGFWAVDNLGNAAFGVSGLDAHLWGGIVLDKGDVLLGNNSNYVWWDASASKLKMTGDLTAASGKVAINDIGITIEQGTGNTSQLKWNRVGVTTPNAFIHANWNGSSGAQSSMALVSQNPLNNSNVTVQHWALNTGSAWLCWVADDFGGVAHSTKLEVYSKGNGANNGMVYTDGALQVGGTQGAFPAAGAVVGDKFYPGNTVDAGYFGRYGANTPFIGGNVVLGGGLYPSNQGSYNWTVSIGVAEMITNAHLRAQNRLYMGASQTASYFRHDGTYTRHQGDFVVDGNIYWGAGSNWLSAYLNQAVLTTSNVTHNIITNSHYMTVGSTGVQYTPNSGNWSNGGSTLVLQGADYSSIAFHDFGSRVDFIRSGAGQIEIGYNGGWGNAQVSVPGNLGVGSAAGTVYRFLVLGADNGATNGVAAFRNSSNTNLMFVRNDGYLYANRAWDTSSDARLKYGTRPLAHGLDAVLALEPSWYRRKMGDSIEYGFIAQEVREVLPELVTENEEGLLSMNYNGIIPVLVNAVKTLAAQIKELRGS